MPVVEARIAVMFSPIRRRGRLPPRRRPKHRRRSRASLGRLPPVVGLVVEDAARRARRRALPGPHEARAVAHRLAKLDAGKTLPGARERRAARGLHRISRGSAATEEFTGDREALRKRAGERSAADLDEQGIRRPPPAAKPSAISKASVRAPSIAKPLSGPCTPNGIAPPRTACRKRARRDRRSRPAGARRP